ncbi:MAG: GrpB family protein [Terrimonas ferruginea]|uniref:GrpB family protein n=1 Tax=Terrimonas ferruginea TaxID=249 RepID=UPI001AD1DA2E|nr:GrpB family protein [Terrimonas ferruginea]MBN8782437.1 GrpB family protein [Terrimonas ferruginea]
MVIIITAIRALQAGKRSGVRRILLPHETFDAITHHLYVCREDGIELHRHLLFRDYLRNHPESRKQYEQIKTGIAIQANQDKTVYAEIKEETARAFIDGVIEKARKDRGI